MIIVGSNISENKAAFLALQAIYGVGENTAIATCNLIGVNPQTKINELNATQLDSLTKNCRRVVKNNKKRANIEAIKKLVKISCYRGTRHLNALPCRGQRTKSNAKSAKNLLSKARTLYK
uniref:Ribosomal protein S13 n=1 Tax=Rhexinema sarcinoideum TaxID=43261 RepID=A0A1B2RYV5_9CHLO|nr:ribosomal protein S13 [Rhexinema sarcinoideum]